MSLLRHTEQYKKSRILRKLLERLTQTDEFKINTDELLDMILNEENLTLTDEEKQKFREQPVDYLLSGPTPRPTGQAQPNPNTLTNSESFASLKSRVAAKLLNDDKMEGMANDDARREHARRLVDEALSELEIVISRAERQRLIDTIVSEIFGLGPLDPLLQDETINEILVLGPKNIFVTRKGMREKASQTFADENHLLRVLDRMVAPTGKRLDEQSPSVSFRLPDGARGEAVISPIAANGPSLTIYKYSSKMLTDEDLVRFGSLSREALTFLQACVQADLNIIISGSETVGKTTLLNILCGFITPYGLTVTIEDDLELHLPQPEVMVLKTQHATVGAKDKMSADDLIRQASRMHAAHIIVGEIRGMEAFELTRSMRTWMTTVRGSSIEATLAFLETLYDHQKFTSKIVYNTLIDSVDLVVHMERSKDGLRKVTRIAEIIKPVDSDYVINELFTFDYQGEGAGKVIGQLKRTDQKPSEEFLARVTGYLVDKPLQEQVRKLFT